MDLLHSLGVLSAAATHDVSATDFRGARLASRLSRNVFLAKQRGGRPTPLLKILQSSQCNMDCAYCAFRSARTTQRTALAPEDLASACDRLHRAGLIKGLFLSSGICGRPDQAMERMVDTVTLLRTRFHFDAYIHLKILPGASNAAIEAALSLADRVSVNLEAPNAHRVARLCPSKHFADDLLRPLTTANLLRGDQPRRVSLTTQMVVGAASEGDDEILRTAADLYRRLGLARVYYSAFSPVRDTPLENLPPAPAWRQYRLYQADRLVAEYGFDPEELAYDGEGHLQPDMDPKLAWARRHPERFPVEVNNAERETLLRVPGIGPRSARRIMQWRREGALSDLKQIRSSGANADRAAPYVLLNGRRPLAQLSLW